MRQIEALGLIVGHQLSDDQVSAINERITRIHGLQQTEKARPGQREVRRHLNALQKASAAEVGPMFDNADTTTRAYIFDRLFARGCLINPSPEAIQTAASDALSRMEKVTPGRRVRGWQHIAAKWATNLYVSCGGSDLSVWAGGDERRDSVSPLVGWTAVFFPPMDRSRIAEILAESLKTISPA